jgi:hypothetical protein
MLVQKHVVAVARRIRTGLLSRGSAERGLAGKCALASMLIAEALGDVSAFRVGFFMQRETLYGRRGRYPRSHAWCRVDGAIVDVTATQFGRFPAIYVVAANDTDRYIERADGTQAIDEVMKDWLLDRAAEYRQIRQRLRTLDDGR